MQNHTSIALFVFVLLFAVNPANAQFFGAKKIELKKEAATKQTRAQTPAPAQKKKKKAIVSKNTRAAKSVSKPQKSDASLEELKQEQEELTNLINELKKTLSESGVIREEKALSLTPEQEAKRSAMQAELADVEKKLKDLKDAVERGLDPKLVASNIQELELKSAELKQSIAAIKPTATPTQLEKMQEEVQTMQKTVTSLKKELDDVNGRYEEMKKSVAEAKSTTSDEKAFPVAGYDKGFFIQSSDGAFRMKIEGRVKTRYTFDAEEIAGVDEWESSTSLSVPYARLYLIGHLFSKRLSYFFAPDFGGGNTRLVWAYGDYAFIPKKLHLRFGLFKRPFSRNYLFPSQKKQFISGPTGGFGHGLDIGVQLSNNYLKVNGLEWAIGVFNSAKPTKPEFSGEVATDDEGNQTVEDGKFSNAIDNFKPALVARLGYNNGIKGYHPTDFEGGPFRFGVAISGHTDFDIDNNDEGQVFLSGDLIMKVQGFSLSSGLYLAWDDEGNIWDNPTFASVGWLGQMGYFFAKRFEPVARYGIEAPVGIENNEQQMTLGFAIYFNKQTFKWENNFTAEFLAEDSLANFQFASQLQMLF